MNIKKRTMGFWSAFLERDVRKRIEVQFTV